MATAKKVVSKASSRKTDSASKAKDVSQSAQPTVKKASAKAPRKANSAFMKAMTPSAALAAVIGDKPLPRTEVTKKIWEYIKKHELQDKAQRTMINADAKLKVIFEKAQVSMFEMTKLISSHLK